LPISTIQPMLTAKSRPQMTPMPAEGDSGGPPSARSPAMKSASAWLHQGCSLGELRNSHTNAAAQISPSAPYTANTTRHVPVCQPSQRPTSSMQGTVMMSATSNPQRPPIATALLARPRPLSGTHRLSNAAAAG
jgi:hypothetical protein